MLFDPYHQWLSIPPAEQPPNHYRLLGVGVFESNLDVISSAADRQMAHIKTFQLGERMADSQRLLSEVVAARACLLNEELRAAYDLQLRLDSAVPAPALPPTAKPMATSAIAPVAAPSVTTSNPSRRQSPSRSRQNVIVIASVVTFVVMVLVVAGIMFRQGGRYVTKQPPPVVENPVDTKTSKLQKRATSPEVPTVPEADVNGSVTPKDPAPEDPEPKDPAFEPPVTPNIVADSSPNPSASPTNIEPVLANDVIDELDLPGKLPIPSKTDQAAAKALVREVYQSEYEQAETSEQKAAVATKLLAGGSDPGNDANARYAMLDVARVMSIHAGDADGTNAVIAQLDAQYEVDALKLEQAAYEAWAKKVLTKETRAELAKRMSPVAEEAARQERYDIAIALLQLSRDTARRASDIQLAKDVAARLIEISRIAAQFAEVKQALGLLAVDASDEAANDVVGRYYCLVRGDWDRGLPLLVKSGKAALQASAERDLSGATPGDEQLALGDMWWDLAISEKGDASQQLLVRAHHWYSVASPNLSGLAKTKCEKRLTETALASANIKGGHGPHSTQRGTGLVFDGRAWLETDLKYDGKAPLTIEAWVTPAADGVQSIVANCYGNGVTLHITKDNQWAFYLRDKKTPQLGVSNKRVRLGERTHIAGVFDGSLVRLYVNGRLQDVFGTMTSGHDASNFRFMIGTEPDSNSRPTKNRHFRGTIDSVHMANAILYKQNFTPRDPPTRTAASVLLLRLDEGEGDIAKDSSGRGHHVKIHNAKWKNAASTPTISQHGQNGETDDIVIESRHVEDGVLDDGELAYANRQFTWFDVPASMKGWRFTRTYGGESAFVAVRAKRDTTLTMAIFHDHAGVDLTGWQAVEGKTFAYTDRDRSRMHVFIRLAKAGQRVVIPQGTWTGGLLLWPPHEK